MERGQGTLGKLVDKKELMTDSCPFLTNVRMNTFPVGNGTMRRKIDFMSASVKLYGNEHLAAHSPPKVNPPALAHYIYIFMSKDKLLFFL